MRRFSWILLAGLALAAPAPANEADVAAIEEVVTRAYVEGIHKEQDPEKIRSGFHSDFVMFVNADEGILKEITGDAAVARVEIHRDGRHTFTDFLSLYRFEEGGWRIIAKTFHRHPTD